MSTPIKPKLVADLNLGGRSYCRTCCHKGDVVLSIVNITMGMERALVGCDTACRYDAPDGKRFGQMSKLLVLQGMGVVMAFRGQRHMFHQIVNRSLFDNEPDCFDSLVDQLPVIISDAKPNYVAFQFESNLELYVVGWSHRFGRITGAWCSEGHGTRPRWPRSYARRRSRSPPPAARWRKATPRRRSSRSHERR